MHIKCFNVKDAPICRATFSTEPETDLCPDADLNRRRPSAGVVAHTHTEKLWRKREQNYSIHFNYRDWTSDLDARRRAATDAAAAEPESPTPNDKNKQMSRLEMQRDSQTRWPLPTAGWWQRFLSVIQRQWRKDNSAQFYLTLSLGCDKERRSYLYVIPAISDREHFWKPYYCLFLVIMQDSGVRLLQLNWFTFLREAKWKMVGYESIIHSNYKGSMLKNQ